MQANQAVPTHEWTDGDSADGSGEHETKQDFTGLTTEEQQALIRAHKNLGHPNPKVQQYHPSAGFSS